jgi:acetylornithine deacetylase/succinyl-diaminopimelate desuccinylase-like protein
LIGEFLEKNGDLVESVFERIERSMELLVARIREIAEIPAPTFEETRRTRYLSRLMPQMGLKDVTALPLGSVVGFTRSAEEAGTIVLASHIDTVFPLETDVTTRIEGSTLHGPGSGDNATSLAGILTLAEIFRDLGVDLSRNLAFAGTVREEGLGNLGGMGEVIDRFGERAGMVLAIDGMTPRLMNRSQAIRRFSMKAVGPGGHSWSDFGTPSAVHEISRIVAALCDLDLPEEPRTTVNVGTMRGGRSVNAIAQECRAQVELRSLSAEECGSLEQKLGRLAREVPAPGVEVSLDLVGTRPAGAQSEDSELVRTVAEAARKVGIEPHLEAASTDAALPLSKGIPALAFGIYRGAGTHTLQEKVDLTSLPQGLKWLALTVLALSPQLR